MNMTSSRVNKEIASKAKKVFAYWLRFHKANHTPVAEVFEPRFAAVFHILGDHSQCTFGCPARKAQEAKQEYTPKQPFLCPKMQWDIKQGLIATILMYTTLNWLKEIIHDGKDVLDNGTHPNEAVNGAAVVMAPKAINYATTASFSDQ
eukprot:7410100-Ditylum_brightwellii.AAC.1